MKNLFCILLFSLLVNTGFAQENVKSDQLLVKITLSDDQAVKAKSLKSIEFGVLHKGINRNTFVIRTEQQQLESLKNELTVMFPNCRLETEGK